jgi:hypothetical protein
MPRIAKCCFALIDVMSFEISFIAAASWREGQPTDSGVDAGHLTHRQRRPAAAAKLLEELDVAGKIVTLDAMHCQKKRSKQAPKLRHI